MRDLTKIEVIIFILVSSGVIILFRKLFPQTFYYSFLAAILLGSLGILVLVTKAILGEAKSTRLGFDRAGIVGIITLILLWEASVLIFSNDLIWKEEALNLSFLAFAGWAGFVIN